MTQLFPATLPANTIVGRLGIGPGPAQAIPFAHFSLNTITYQAQSDLAAAYVGSGVDAVAVMGYATGGDGGFGFFKRVSAEPTQTGGKVQSADGTWWDYDHQGVINVKVFGAKGDSVTDDSAAFTNAASLNGDHLGSYVWIPPSTTRYEVHDILISKGWYSFKAALFTVTLHNNSLTHPRITTTTTADLTYPTNSNAGPMRGCAFYITQETSISYFPHIEGIEFNGYRFAIAFQQTPFSPVIQCNKFTSCNAGVFNYTGSENQKVVNNFSDFTDCIYIAGSTCFPSGSSYVGGSTYCDGLTLGNIDDNSQAQFSRLTINDYFDDWFVASILRPSTDSISAYGTFKYKDASGAVYADNDTHCRPSGRACFIAARNTEGYFEMTLTNIALVTQAYRGVGLVNGVIHDFTYYKPQGEGIWDVSAPDATFPILEVGGIANGTMHLGSNSLFSYLGTYTHPLIKSTGRGNGNLNQLIYLGTDTNPTSGVPIIGFNRSNLHRTGERINLTENVAGTFFSGGTQLMGPSLTSGSVYTDNNVYTVREGIPFVTDFPRYNSGASQYNTDIQFSSFASDTDAKTPAGEVTIAVLNRTEGAWDIGKFYVEFGSYAGLTETLTTAANCNNGDAYITVTSNPTTTARFVRWTIAAGVTVIQDYYDATTKRIYVLGGLVTGLAAQVNSGASITRTQTCTTLQPFQRDWVSFGLGLVSFSNAYNFTLKDNVQAYTDGVANPSLHVVMTYRAVPTVAEASYLNGLPTGRWNRGALTRSSTPTAGGFANRVCVTGGNSPVFAGVNPIGGPVYKTNSATSGATLTAANVTGGPRVVLNLTGALGGAANAQLPTVADLIAAVPYTTGDSYWLRIINSSSGAFAWTVTTNTGWTLSGTMSIAQNTFRDFIVTMTSATAATIQQVGTGTTS